MTRHATEPATLSEQPDYEDCSLPFELRVEDLVSRMTLEEKIRQMMNDAPPIPRLGVPRYNWWNECLHGVARAGNATVFPQAIGLAATWSNGLVHEIASAISDEARAKHHEAIRNGRRGLYEGLTFWSPNINIFRDPRWGRGQETYGEDPHLTSMMGIAFVKGLQGDHPLYLKLVATPKHYAVHSGPEEERHFFNAVIDLKDLYDTYLPAFEACVKEAGAQAIMAAYNRINGEACCASPRLLGEILRRRWGFKGFVVADCGAIYDLYERHRLAATPEEAAASSVKAGCDLECGGIFLQLMQAAERGLITEAEIDVAVKRLFMARFRLGMFDPPELVPYSQIPVEVIGCERHKQLALQAARESLVLLKNENQVLPLRRDLNKVAVIGPSADRLDVLLGNYNGQPATYVTLLKGIQQIVSPNTEVAWTRGCGLTEDSEEGFTEASEIAQTADAIVFVGGISPVLEGEESLMAENGGGGDRTTLDLPEIQERLLKLLCATGKPTVLVLFSGSCLSVNWADGNVPAILQAWYPGQEGGLAVAEALFGDYNPGGRLPITFYKSLDQVPPFTNYSMEGRTYRFMRDEPLYPFGHGLSYTQFRYENLVLLKKSHNSIRIRVEVSNIGQMAGDEVVQLYVTDLAASTRIPKTELKGFERVHFLPGEKKRVYFKLMPRQLSHVNARYRRVVEPGSFQVFVGGGQPGYATATSSNILTASFEITQEITSFDENHSQDVRLRIADGEAKQIS
jgi:beta-glucosidase